MWLITGVCCSVGAVITGVGVGVGCGSGKVLADVGCVWGRVLVSVGVGVDFGSRAQIRGLCVGEGACGRACRRGFWKACLNSWVVCGEGWLRAWV